MRIVIVDDDIWIRTGRRVALSGFPSLEVVADLDPDEAIGYEWNEVDIAIVDAHDSTQEWDRYPGVAVVESIRESRSPAQTTIIVISGRIFDPMLRLRMAEAGADYFYGHLDVSTPKALADLVRQPQPVMRSEPPDSDSLAELGLRSWARPNQALRWLADSGSERHFTGTGSQKTAGASRRTLDRVRDQVARLAHLEPALADPQRRPGDATWRDVNKFVQRALGRSGLQRGPQ